MRVRGVTLGGLLLGFTRDGTPSAAQTRAAVSFACLGALVLDSEKLYEEARAAEQARDHFLMAINHEMRTPATALMLQADLLRSGYYGELPEKLAEALGSLEDDVSDLIRVTRAVLDLGSLEAGSPAAAPEMVEPRRLVLDLLRRVEPTAKRKGLTLSVYVPRSLPVMQTDGGRLSRILLHLFANGIRYTETGGVEVRVERVTGSVGARKSEPLLRIRIADTGSGIPPEELARIFEPFAQADEGARTASATRGYGLGLSLARKLARSLGGDINIESSTPRGTSIVLAVPYRRAEGYG
jgi:signal transduction histidine kinase